MRRKLSSMQISEIYASRQGEGRLTGQPSVILRTSGCNLRCDFCDTPFASWKPEGEELSLSEIVQRVQTFPPRHVVITGGEPMLQKQIEELTQRLKDRDFHITIETAGTIDKDVVCDLMSISPKMENSTPTPERAGEWSRKHQQARYRPEVISKLIAKYDYQLKFVVKTPEDVGDIIAYLAKFDEIQSHNVLLMPEGVELNQLQLRAQWMLPICNQHGFTYCPRKHIEWYGNQRGT